MSGFAALNGEPDGPPPLPRLRSQTASRRSRPRSRSSSRCARARKTGRGQVVDLSLVEPLLTLLGPQPTAYDQPGAAAAHRQPFDSHAPRNVYRTSDGRWVAVSASARRSPSAS